MISLQDISLRLGIRTLFDGLSWHINPGSRIGLVGDNGSGKTTLFRVILGDMKPESGSVVMPKSMTVGYLPQQQAALADVTVMAYLRSRCGVSDVEAALHTAEKAIGTLPHGTPAYHDALRRYEAAHERYAQLEGHVFESRAERVLHGLGFRAGASQADCRSFSGGWQMRICLAALLLNEPDAMLLDEPTNHLDTDSMEWLEQYLKGYRGTIVAVAHDRAFLDRVTTCIAHLRDGSVATYPGNYTSFLRQKAEKQELLDRQNKKLERERAHIEDFIDRFKAKATKAAQARSRQKMLDRLETPHASGMSSSRAVTISFPPCRKSGIDVFSAAGLTKRYGDLEVFAGVDLRIGRGEKVGLIGTNGAGKSTLLRMLTQGESPTAGESVQGRDLDIGYFSQTAGDVVATADGSVWDQVEHRRGSVPPQTVRDLLGAFLFAGDDIQKPVSVLSGGERSRLALLQILLQGPNVLVLDEPTNHLDMHTKDVFMQALKEYEGTLLLVSHDRFLLDHVVTRVLELRDGRLYDYAGNYSYFIEKRELDQAKAEQPRACTAESPKRTDRAADYAERKRQNRLVEQLQRRRDEAEKLVSRLEQRKGDIEAELCDPGVFEDPARASSLGDELAQLEAKIDKTYNEWGELCDRIAAMEDELRERDAAA